MSPFDPLFEAFLYVCGGGCCFFGSALFSLFFMRAVSERSAVSIRVLGNMCPLATDTSSGVFISPGVVLDLGQLRAIFQSGSVRGICLIPGRVYAPAVAVRALPRVSAQLSTSARDRGGSRGAERSWPCLWATCGFGTQFFSSP